MATSIRSRRFPPHYDEHVYAGVLGLIIGVQVGRKQGDPQRLVSSRELGRIGYDLNFRGDGLATGPSDLLELAFTAVRSFEDFGYSFGVGSEHAAGTFFNYAIENRSTLWWGGMGRSAPHTAYLRLKRGVPVSDCGSFKLNGELVSAQAGAEMIGPLFGLLIPSDPAKAADLAGKTARVFYDGEAVCAAQAAAALVSAGFSAKDHCALFDAVLPVLPLSSAVASVIADVYAWSSVKGDWKHTRELIHDKYFGVFNEGHAAPAFAGIALALAHGGGSFKSAFEVAALSGWGGPLTLGVLGCVLGNLHGLLELESVPHWLGALNDRLQLPGADGGRCMSDAASVSQGLIRTALALQTVPSFPLKKGARCNFELPRSTHGFAVEISSDSPGLAVIRNVEGHSRAGKRSLAIEYTQVCGKKAARVSLPVFDAGADIERIEGTEGIEGIEGSSGRRCAQAGCCPALHPGQTVRAFVEADENNAGEIGVRPFIRYLGAGDQPEMLRGPEKLLLPEARHEFKWRLPDGLALVGPSDTIVVRRESAPQAPPLGRPSLGLPSLSLMGCPILEVGLEIFQAHPAATDEVQKAGSGLLYLDYFTWDDTPKVELGPPRHDGLAWRETWLQAATQVDFGTGARALSLSQDEGVGMLIQGSRDWRDYSVLAALTPVMAQAAGVAVRVQGMQRYYALLLCAGNKLRLVKQFHRRCILAEADFSWHFGQTVELGLSVEGNRLLAKVEGTVVFDVEDSVNPLDGGAVALVVEEGCVESGAVRVE